MDRCFGLREGGEGGREGVWGGSSMRRSVPGTITTTSRNPRIHISRCQHHGYALQAVRQGGRGGEGQREVGRGTRTICCSSEYSMTLDQGRTTASAAAAAAAPAAAPAAAAQACVVVCVCGLREKGGGQAGK